MQLLLGIGVEERPLVAQLGLADATGVPAEHLAAALVALDVAELPEELPRKDHRQSCLGA